MVLGVPEGSEAGSQAVSGVVLVGAMSGGTLLNDKTGGVPQPPLADDGFGAAVASADFNHDGLADLAVGVPGRGGVSVFYALDRTARFLDSAELAKPPEVGAFGAALVAGDFNGDGIADLAVGAPGTKHEQRSHQPGSIDILFGGARGLSPANAARIPEVWDREQGFGSRLAAGDVDRDGRLDLVEGAPSVPGVNNGHLSYCEGGRRGPSRCVDLPDASASGLAVGDINGDRFADVVAGDADYGDGGGVKVWLGRRSPLSGKPAVITQRTDGVPGDPASGDEFGNDVAIGEVTGDRWRDIVVTAPGGRERRRFGERDTGQPHGRRFGRRAVRQAADTADRALRHRAVAARRRRRPPSGDHRRRHRRQESRRRAVVLRQPLGGRVRPGGRSTPPAWPRA